MVHAGRDATQPLSRGAFGRFPNSVARDRRVTPAVLVVLAYRSTFVGAFALRPELLGRLVSRGLGKNAAQHALRVAAQLGYLDRRQQPGPSPRVFGIVKEQLTFPPAESDARIVWRAWFDGSLGVQQMAALLYVRAGAGKGPRVYRREVQERFGWSAPFTRAVLKSLRRRELLIVRDPRARGKFQGAFYVAARMSSSKLEPADVVPFDQPEKNHSLEYLRTHPGSGSPGNGAAGDSLTSDNLDGLVKKEASTLTSSNEEEETTPRFASGLPVFFDPWDHPNILGWIHGDQCEAEWYDVSDEDVDDVALAWPDDKLSELVRKAAGGRVHRDILTREGCEGVRYLAAFLLTKDYADDALCAMDVVLRSIGDRIGSRPGQWMNSLALIGRRIAGELYTDGCEAKFYSKVARRSG